MLYGGRLKGSDRQRRKPRHQRRSVGNRGNARRAEQVSKDAAMPVKYTRPERMSIRLHPELSEKWVQDLIASEPLVLGLGELVLIGKERTHPHAGRLDLLLQDPETKRRYEVE